MSEWISVEDRLPESHECVDVWGRVAGGYNQGDESRITDCFCDHKTGLWWRWNSKCSERVYLTGFFIDNWMPLPEPPESEQ